MPWKIYSHKTRVVLLPSEKLVFLTFLVPNKAYVLVCHDLHDIMNGRLSKVRLWYEKILYRRISKADRIITVSQNTKKELLNFLGVDNSLKVDVIHNPVEDSWFDRIGEDRLHEVSNVKGNFLLLVGTNAWYKNLEWAFKHISRLGLPIVKVGPLPEEFNIDSFNQPLVHLPFIDEEELQWLYQNALCLLFPSIHEGFGWPVLEAMASGCPVVAARNSSITEVGGDAICYFDNGDENQMLEWIEKIKNAPSFRAKLSQSGVERAEKFRMETFKVSWQDILTPLVV
ncbi:glycosyltransferase family 1 protein [Roseivirga sp. UBA838]|uniref:glycosyltransferase family 4 protein n=1 Tax=Roseivirga sp. UBA838 TaxID=1947393 RepID=UPI002579F2CF|nr:glycosyltransferase family 1 protein [Roseivirga sp. UBA838]